MDTTFNKPHAPWIRFLRIRYLTLAALLFVVTGCNAGSVITSHSQNFDGGTWLTLAPAPVATQEIGVAELDGDIYVFGGLLGNRTVGDLVQVYNIEADQWRQVAPMPAALHHMAAAAANGKLYVVGGYQGNFIPVSSVFEYDPATNIWAAKSRLPTQRGGLLAASINGLIYAVGGARGTSVGDLAVYDPSNDTWTSLTPMPTPRDHHAVAAIDGLLYVAGGRNSTSFILDTLEVYDPARDQWTRLSPMPTGRSGIAGAALGGCLYVLGGEGNRFNVNPQGVFPEVERYNPATDSWATMTPMALPRHGIGAVGVGNRIHVPAGGPVQGFGVTDMNDALEVPSEVSCRS